MSFDAREEKVMGLFNRKVYNVPRNQRRYVWDKENWQELFDDIMAVANGKLSSHFIGSIVLKTDPVINGVPRYSVIDGQQRIITLSILFSSIMFWMKKYEMNDDFEGTIPYVIAKDDKNRDITMVTAENNESLESIISAITQLSKDEAEKITVNSIVEGNLLDKSDNNIANAFKFYMNALFALYEENGKNSQIFINIRDVVRNITFINITATTEEDSYTIFEILNARGLDLEDHELLKNYIMRYIQPEEDRDQAKAVWNRIESKLGHTELKRFVRHYAIHRYGDYKSKSGVSVYKVIQDKNRGQDTQKLLQDLEKKAESYLCLIAPSKNEENPNCNEIEYRVYSFFKKKRQEQLRPLLLSLISKKKEGKLSAQLYEKTIIFLYNFNVCYNIIGEESSNRLTDIINKYAAKIEDDCSDEMIKKCVDELRKKLPTEKMFINAFNNVGWSHHDGIYEGQKNKNRVQIVLEVMERYYTNGKCLDDFTIEHVFDDSENTLNGQIGNLIPLETNLNKRCIDKTFEEKMDIYSESSYFTARKFAKRYKGKTFSPEKRTEYMAKMFYTKILQM